MANNQEYLIKIYLDLQGDPALKALTDQMDKMAKTVPKAQKALKGAAKDNRAFGRSAANAGYQVQDLVVQIQGGVDPMRALSQQLPQMFIGFGAFGAALGVVAAIMPTVIEYFKGAEDVSIDFSEAISELNSALSATTQTVDTLDFSSWNESWNAAARSVHSLQGR